uniref:Cysteine-rich membrane protein 2 n=1 Tax=Spironucleus salmonicida TaxID=348837 RepID=V6LMI9_9EUKA|eukprot:EST45855.1 Cysteine-rich membrane protein 2 [Spironucleus salmonicida]
MSAWRSAPGLPTGTACVDSAVVECGGRLQMTQCACQNAVNCLSCSEDGTKCGSCLAGYELEALACLKCAADFYQVGVFCFSDKVDPVKPNRISTGGIIGIVIAILVAVGVVGGVVGCCMRKKKHTAVVADAETVVAGQQ